jgi:hypothetical protein
MLHKGRKNIWNTLHLVTNQIRVRCTRENDTYGTFFTSSPITSHSSTRWWVYNVFQESWSVHPVPHTALWFDDTFQNQINTYLLMETWFSLDSLMPSFVCSFKTTWLTTLSGWFLKSWEFFNWSRNFLLQDLMIYYCVHSKPLLDLILSHPVYNLVSFSSNVYFNVNLPFTPIPNGLFLQILFWLKFYMHFSSPPCIQHIPPISPSFT